MEDITQYTIGFLTLVLLLSGIFYIAMGEEVRLRIDNDKSTFYVKLKDDNGDPYGRWLVSGRETNKLKDGTKTVWRYVQDITVDHTIIDNIITITRVTPFRNGATIIDTYTFNGSIDDAKLFPIEHKIDIYDAVGYIYEYEVKDLKYTGNTIKDISSPQYFGLNMIVEWEPGYYYSKIYKYKNSDTGKLTIKYRPQTDHETYYVRLFDPPSADLIAYYTFEGTPDDSFGDYNGTVNGGVANTTGFIEDAYGFNGVDSYINMGDIFYSDKLTICTWFNATSLDTNLKGLVLKRNIGTVGSANEFWMISNSSNVLWYSWNSDGDTSLFLKSNVTPSLNNWHHVCVVQNGTGNTGYMYMDNVLVNSSIQGNAMKDSDSDLQVGTRANNNNGRWWNGSIDEVAIWDRSLSAIEIRDVYLDYLEGNTPFNSSVENVDGLVAYYPFDNDSRDDYGSADGTVSGNVANVSGFIGNAYRFDGNNDWVDTNQNFSDPLFTRMAWINAGSDTGNYEAVMGDSQYSGSFLNGSVMRYGSGESFGVTIGSSGADTTMYKTLPRGTWYFVVTTYDGTSYKFYVNGKLIDSSTIGFDISYKDLFIGYDYTNNADFNGTIDEVSIWDRALSDIEIRGYYANYIEGDTPLNASLRQTFLIYYISNSGDDTNNGTSSGSPIKTIAKLNNMTIISGDSILFNKGDTWRFPTDAYPVFVNGNASHSITVSSYGTGASPIFLGSLNLSNEANWTEIDTNKWNATFALDYDVGLMIFNDETILSVKKNNLTSLDTQGDFYSNVTEDTLTLYSVGTPSVFYDNIEASQKSNMFTGSFDNYLIENLTFKYGGGGMAISLGSDDNVTIRYCNISFIGGVYQHGLVKYGNAIQIWCSGSNITIEYNNISNTYDAGVSHQCSTGSAANFNDIIYRNNIITSAHYCYEIFQSHAGSNSTNIYFENNTCYNSTSWSDNQRPDANGRSVRFGTMIGDITNFNMRNNIFDRADSYHLSRGTFNNLSNLNFSNNLYYMISDKVFALWDSTYDYSEFDDYVTEQNLDNDSVTDNPLLYDTDNNDFRPSASSPACSMSSTGSYVGALPCNQASAMQTVSIVPSPAYSNETLVGSCNASDADSDDVQYDYMWFKDDVLQTIETTFNHTDSTTEKIVYTGDENTTYYLELDKSANVFDATITLTGAENSYEIDQEDVNLTALDTARFADMNYAVDNLWNSNFGYFIHDGSPNVKQGLFYENFSYSDVNASSIDYKYQLSISTASSGDYYNYEGISGGLYCRNTSSGNFVNFTYYCYGFWCGNTPFAGSGTYTETIPTDCIGDSIVEIRTYVTTDLNGVSGRYPKYGFYEAKIIVKSYPDNPWLEIGIEDASYEWNYTSRFDTSDTSDDLSSAINSALDGGACTGGISQGDNCTIPFKFHSDTYGNLTYSDIDVKYALNTTFFAQNVVQNVDNVSSDDTLYGEDWILSCRVVEVNDDTSSWMNSSVAGIDNAVSAFTLEGSLTDITAELGSIVNAIGEINTSENICIDINHSDTGTNISCGINGTSYDINITYFDTTLLNDSSTIKNLTYAAAGNETVYISGHQYDEIINFTVNLTGYENGATFPGMVNVYINDTLSNILGPVEFLSDVVLTNFNDSSTVKTLFLNPDTVQNMTLRLPKTAILYNATLNMEGSNYTFGGYDDTENSWNYTTYITTGAIYNPELAVDEKHNTGVSLLGDVEVNITEVYIHQPFWEEDMRWWWNSTIHWVSSNIYVHIYNYTSSSWVIAEYYEGLGGGDSPPYDFKQTWYGLNSSNPLMVKTMCNYNSDKTTVIYQEGALTWKGFPQNLSMEVGIIDGVHEWNASGSFNVSEQTNNFSSAISAYLDSCTADDDNYCYVPIFISSDSSGILNITNVIINYSTGFNPVVLDKSLVETFLNNSDGDADIPIRFETSNAGILQISDIRYRFRGGNKTYSVKLHTPGYNVNNTINITYYYSNWDYILPSGVEYIDFFPSTPTTLNETPFGQKDSTPILNLTSYAYGGKNIESYMLNNVSDSCVDLYVSSNNTKPSSSLWDGLVVNIPMDIDARDITGNENNGTIVGATLVYGSEDNSILGNAYNFSSNYISISDHADFDFSTEMSVSSWVRLDDLDGIQVIVSKWDISNSKREWYISSITGYLVLTTGTDAGGNGGFEKSDDIVLTGDGVTWNHVVFTYNAGTIVLYVNGTAVDSTTTGSVVTTLYNDDQDINIGSYEDGAGLFFDGIIDEVRIYNRTLTANEINEIYTRQSSGFSDVKLNDEWTLYNYNQTYLDNFGLWMWADLDCSYTSWQLFQPDYYFRNCAIGYDVCDEELV